MERVSQQTKRKDISCSFLLLEQDPFTSYVGHTLRAEKMEHLVVVTFYRSLELMYWAGLSADETKLARENVCVKLLYANLNIVVRGTLEKKKKTSKGCARWFVYQWNNYPLLAFWVGDLDQQDMQGGGDDVGPVFCFRVANGE